MQNEKMEGEFYLLRPCKTSAAYEAIPKKNIRIDLGKCSSRLKIHGYKIACDAKVMLVVRNGCEISIHPSGKLIIKTDLEDVAKSVADRIYELIV
jgi:hypothetical protein